MINPISMLDDDENDNDIYNDFLVNPQQKQRDEEEMVKRKEEQERNLRTTYSLDKGAEKIGNIFKKNTVNKLFGNNKSGSMEESEIWDQCQGKVSKTPLPEKETVTLAQVEEKMTQQHTTTSQIQNKVTVNQPELVISQQAQVQAQDVLQQPQMVMQQSQMLMNMNGMQMMMPPQQL